MFPAPTQGYVKFTTPTPGEVVVVSTLEVGSAKPERVLGDRTSIREALTTYGLAAYRVRMDEIGSTRPVVVGSITSSHGLRLDPSEVSRIAGAAPYVSHGIVASVRALKAEMEAEGIALMEKPNLPGEEPQVESAVAVEPSLAAKVVAAAQVESSSSTRVDVTVFVDPALEDLLDDVDSADEMGASLEDQIQAILTAPDLLVGTSDEVRAKMLDAMRRADDLRARRAA